MFLWPSSSLKSKKQSPYHGLEAHQGLDPCRLPDFIYCSPHHWLSPPPRPFSRPWTHETPSCWRTLASAVPSPWTAPPSHVLMFPGTLPKGHLLPEALWASLSELGTILPHSPFPSPLDSSHSIFHHLTSYMVSLSLCLLPPHLLEYTIYKGKNCLCLYPMCLEQGLAYWYCRCAINVSVNE